MTNFCAIGVISCEQQTKHQVCLQKNQLIKEVKKGDCLHHKLAKPNDGKEG